MRRRILIAASVLVLAWNCYAIYRMTRQLALLETTVAQICEDLSDGTDIAVQECAGEE